VPATIFEFGDFRLDCSRFELWRAGRSLKLERKPMELLILLASREGDLVNRAEIAERLWGNEVFVDTEHGINTAVRKIRQVLRDDPDQPRFVQTVMGRGYRFVGPISEVHPSPAAKSSPPSLARQPESVALDAISIPTATTTESSAVVENHRRRLHGHFWRITGAFAALLLLTIAAALRAHWLVRSAARDATPNIGSVAVLPLDNLSGDPNQNYFADGMTDELITMLAKNSKLRVVSRTSAMQ
jgi:DNA-binding winged helix-turn-helix (wHTH) protein